MLTQPAFSGLEWMLEGYAKSELHEWSAMCVPHLTNSCGQQTEYQACIAELVNHSAVHHIHALVWVVKVHDPCGPRWVLFACLLAIIGCTLLLCRSAQGDQSHHWLHFAAVQINPQRAEHHPVCHGMAYSRAAAAQVHGCDIMWHCPSQGGIMTCMEGSSLTARLGPLLSLRDQHNVCQ